jgi:hypothetical protein
VELDNRCALLVKILELMETQVPREGPEEINIGTNTTAAVPPQAAAEKTDPSSAKGAAKKPVQATGKDTKKTPSSSAAKDAKKKPNEKDAKKKPSNGARKKDTGPNAKCTCSMSFLDGHRRSKCMLNQAVKEVYINPQVPVGAVPTPEIFPTEMVKICCCTSSRKFTHEDGKCLAPSSARRLKRMLLFLLNPEMTDAVGTPLEKEVSAIDLDKDKAVVQPGAPAESTTASNTPVKDVHASIVTPDLSGLKLPASPPAATAARGVQTNPTVVFDCVLIHPAATQDAVLGGETSIASETAGASGSEVLSQASSQRTVESAQTQTSLTLASAVSPQCSSTAESPPNPPIGTNPTTPPQVAYVPAVPSLTSSILASRTRAAPSSSTTSQPENPTQEPRAEPVPADPVADSAAAAVSVPEPTQAPVDQSAPSAVHTVGAAATPPVEHAAHAGAPAPEARDPVVAVPPPALALTAAEREALYAQMMADFEVQVQGQQQEQEEEEDSDDDDVQTVVTAVAAYIRRKGR